MILYNYRYRGPYEYDKFILNTLQLINETDMLEETLLDNEFGTLDTILKQLDNYIEVLTGDDSILQEQLEYSFQIGG